MGYKFDPNAMYRMPTHFGPRTGPRYGPDGRKFECKDNPKSTSITVSFLTNSEQLEAFPTARISRLMANPWYQCQVVI